MGDVVSSNIGSTFDSAFRHNYNNVRHTSYPSEQSKVQPNQQNDVYLGSSLKEFNPIDVSNQVIVDTVTNEHKTHKQKVVATAIIGTTSAVVVGTTLLLTKGKIPKAVTNKLGEYSDRLSKYIDKLKTNNPNASDAYLVALQKVNKGLMTTRGVIFNITPLKDVLFDRLMSKLHLKKPCDAITNGFRKLSLSTVKSNYRKAGASLGEMSNLFLDTNKALETSSIAGAKPVSPEALKTLNEKVSQIGSEFNSSFSNAAITKRDGLISKICKNLNTRVFDRVYGNLMNFVKDVKSWTTFIPEMLIEKDKTKFLRGVLDKKKVITNNPKDNFNKINEVISLLENSINPKDKASRKLVEALKEFSSRYLSISGANEQSTRKEIIDKINKLLKSSKDITSKPLYTPDESQKIKSCLNEIGYVINTDKKGLIEEVLTTYKDILPKEKYLELRAKSQKAVDRLNKAVFQEGNNYVDKVRDLTDGSALTDVAFSAAVPMISTGIAVAAADTKEKKQSVGLKYGIPIITGAITSMLATVKLVSGGKALGLGIVSTLITNQICGGLDKYLKSKSNNTQKA